MKIFISHKNEDSSVAVLVQTELKRMGVDAYLDVLDSSIVFKGEKLTSHIKSSLKNCTDILVVLTPNTKESWWVPFEIGMAAQLDFPIVNYLPNFAGEKKVDLPDYLSYWPKLTKSSDLIKYINAKNKVVQEIALEKSFGRHMFAEELSQTERFYKELKNML